MGFLHMPRASRKMQRTLKNLRVSLLCFLLTFLVLRNTIGAGKFGTPAQDFEEIRQHLHYVGLHRRHFRVLAEAVEEEEKHREAPVLVLERRSPLPAAGVRQGNVRLREYGEAQANAVIVRQGSTSLLTSRPLQGGLPNGNVGLQKDLEGSRIDRQDAQTKTIEALASRGYGAPRVLLLTGVQMSVCANPAGVHFILKSLQNKVDYSALHAFEVSLSSGGLDPETAKPASKLSLLQSTLLKYPQVEWVWWMPDDVRITDMAFKLPMENYTDFNLVLLSSDDKSHPRKWLIDLNADTFLIRNCQWSLDLLRVRMRAVDGDQADRLLTNSLLKGPHLAAGDQSALILLPNQGEGDHANKVYVEHSAVLHANWRDVAEKLERIVKQLQRGIASEKLPFITHFIGCNACLKVEDDRDDVCAKQVDRAFAYAEKQSKQSYVLQQKSLASS